MTLLDRMLQELPLIMEQVDVEKETLLQDIRIHAIVERWAMDYSSRHKDTTATTDEQQQQQQPLITEIVDHAEVLELLESCQRHNIPVDSSTLELIHRVKTGQWAGSAASSQSVLTLNKDNLLSTLQHVERTGYAMAIESPSVVDEIMRQVSYEKHKPVAAWMQQVLDTLWSIDKKHGTRLKLRPDYSMYLSVMRAWYNSKDKNKGSKMQNLLDDMKAYSSAGEIGLFPGRSHFALMLAEFAQTGDAHGAMELMQYIKERYQATGLTNYEPTRRMYSLCLEALAKSNRKDNWWHAETLKRELFEAYEVNGNQDLLPRNSFWKSYIAVLTRAGDDRALETAELVLDDIRTDKGRLRPTVRHYGPIIRGWATLGRPKRSEQLLLRMTKKYLEGHQQSKPDPKAFLDVINAWARSGDGQAEDRIRQLTRFRLEILGESSSESDQVSSKPGNDGLGDLMKMLSTAADERDAELAESLLMDAVKQKENGTSDLRITQQHYQAAIAAWSRTRSMKSLDRTTNLFQEMLNRYDSGDEDLRPTEHAYTSVITAHAKSGREDCGEKAQDVFNNMVERYALGEESLRPSVRSYSALIKAWVAAERPDRAEHVLVQMHDDFLAGNDDARPNTISFNTALSAWSKHRSEEALDHATRILRLMQDLGESHLQLKPNTVSFATAIACCINSKSPYRVELAESFFHEALDRYAAGHKECRPTGMIYGAVIQTIARSNIEDVAERAEMYLQEMLTLDDFDARQILLSHNAVIGAWSRHDDKHLALEKAENLKRNLIEISRRRRSQACLPNKFTYAQLLTILSKSDSSDKLKRLQATMKEMRLLGVQADEAIDRLVAKCST